MKYGMRAQKCAHIRTHYVYFNIKVKVLSYRHLISIASVSGLKKLILIV